MADSDMKPALPITGTGKYILRNGNQVTVHGMGHMLIGGEAVYHGITQSGDKMEWRYDGEHYCETTAKRQPCSNDIVAKVDD